MYKVNGDNTIPRVSPPPLPIRISGVLGIFLYFPYPVRDRRRAAGRADGGTRADTGENTPTGPGVETDRDKSLLVLLAGARAPLHGAPARGVYTIYTHIYICCIYYVRVSAANVYAGGGWTIRGVAAVEERGGGGAAERSSV